MPDTKIQRLNSLSYELYEMKKNYGDVIENDSWINMHYEALVNAVKDQQRTEVLSKEEK